MLIDGPTPASVMDEMRVTFLPQFLGLPRRDLKASELREKVNKGKYDGGMDPAIRRRLEEFFEPHNQRLYDHLGVDFGW